MNIEDKLNYVSGKLGLIPAFGDSIGREVNKAELGLCQKYAASALANHRAFGNMLSDASKQLDTLTGENLAIYARTFAALARVALEKANQRDC